MIALALRRTVALTAAAVVACSLLMAFQSTQAASPAAAEPVAASSSAAASSAASSSALAAQAVPALSGSEFNPGNIISDATFYDRNTMSEGDIQAFLNAQVSSCASGYTCLKNYSENTNARAADARCSAYPGGNRSGASIIYWVAQACGINPQVLIVMLQKEQGLVTATSPSQSRFTIAMGYACPDTAPCDTAYYGFFNQLYSAAHQLKNYQANPNSWSYRAGRTNTIYWHPNASCGTSQVYIENQATAALYIYTPYRPNAAALANLYGSGDGCSSYGNRNFWRYFNDWFGNTLAGGSMAKAANDSKIYVVTPTSKYYVPDQETLVAMYALGPVRTVDQSYLDNLTTGPTVKRTIYDSNSGNIYYVDGGVKYRAPTCDMVAAYGGSCSELVSLTAGQIALFPTGADLTGLVRANGVATVYYLADGKKYPVATMDDAFALAGRGAGTVLTMNSPVLSAKPTGKTVLGPGRLVKSPDNADVFMIDGLNTKVRVSSFAVPAELGVTSYRTVAKELIDSYATSPADLTTNLVCGSSNYIGGSGRLWTVASLNGLGSTTVDSRTCETMPRQNDQPAASYVVQQAGTPALFWVDQGKKRAIPTMEVVNALTGGQVPLYVQLSSQALAAIPAGADVLGPSLLVKSPTSPQIFFVDGLRNKIPVNSFAVPGEFGRQGYSTVSQAALDSYTTAGSALTSNLVCGSSTFIGGNGGLWYASGANGLATTSVDPLSCAALPKKNGSAPRDLFIRSTSTGEIFFMDSGRKRYVSSGEIGAAVAAPEAMNWVDMTGPTAEAIPRGVDMLGPGSLVKGSSSADIYLITTLAQKIKVSSFDIPLDQGRATFSTVNQAVLDSYATSSGQVLPILSSLGQYFIAAEGQLWRIPASTGAPATDVDPRVVANLGAQGGTFSGRVFVKGIDDLSGTIYVLQSGGKRAVATMSELISLNGGTQPRWLNLRPASLALIPTV